MLVRTQWIEGVSHYERLFRDRPPTLYAPFVERVPMVKGRWDLTRARPRHMLGLFGSSAHLLRLASSGFRRDAGARCRDQMIAFDSRG